MMKVVVRISILTLLLCLPCMGRAQMLPDHLVPAEVERLDAEKETVGGAYPGLLVVPKGEQDAKDKFGQPARAACVVYAGEGIARQGDRQIVRGYGKRFVVHAPDADALPLAKRVARLLLILHGQNRERLRYEHPVSLRTVEVWLLRQGGQGHAEGAAGEQSKNQITLYAVLNDRRPIEWAREIAHEYGHYALPGVSGYTAPEEWANGVLGERLFLKWLRDDLKSGKLRPEDVPFVTPEQLEEYAARQIAPLARRIAQEGLNEAALKRRDAAGMDYYTGFVLYLDALYGSKGVLDALTYTTPSEGVFTKAIDFLRGARESLQSATEMEITVPAAKEQKTVAFWAYLPRGEYSVVAEAPMRAWRVDVSKGGIQHPDAKTLYVAKPGWRKLTVSLAEAGETPGRLILRRRGAEVQ